MTLSLFRRLVALLALCALPASASTTTAPQDKQFAVTTQEQIKWQDVQGGLGTQFAVIRGNPAGPGLYVIRVKFPPNVMDTPHSHPNDRYVTVLKGTWYAGTGEKFDVTKAQKLEAGSFMFHPGGGAHWDGAAGDEEVIVEVIGEGPASTNQVDERQPMWLKVN